MPVPIVIVTANAPAATIDPLGSGVQAEVSATGVGTPVVIVPSGGFPINVINGGGPPVTPDPLPATGIEVFEGDSLTSGIQVVAGQKNWVKPNEGSSDAVGLLDTHISTTIVNRAIGGTKTAQILTRVQAETTAQKAGKHRIWPGRNDITADGEFPDLATYMVARYNDFMAAVTGNVTFFGCSGGPEFRLTERWTRKWLANRKLQQTFPARFVNIDYALVRGGTGTGQDQTDMLVDRIPLSLHNSSADYVHFAQNGTQVIYGEMMKLQRAEQGYAPYVTPFAEIYLSGSAATAAQANGGAIGQAACFGSPTSFSLAGGGGNFAISNTGAITHANGNALTAAWYDLDVTATNTYGSTTGKVRVFIGAASTASPQIASPSGVAGARTTRDRSAFQGGVQKLSVAALIRGTGVAGTIMNPQGSANSAFSMTSASGTLAFTGRNSSATTVCAINTGSGAVNTIPTGTRKWAFLTVDLVAGTGSITVDDGTTATTIAASTATAGASLDLAAVFYLFCANNSASQSTLQGPFTGGIQAFWLTAGNALDFTQASVRQNFHASGSVEPIDLGATGVVASITPEIYMAGNLGDWAYGRNRGAMGDLAMWLSNDASASMTAL